MSHPVRHVAAATLIGLAPALSLLATAPVAAQSRAPAASPAIAGLQVNADNGLSPGSTLRFSVQGTPRGQARVRVAGSALNLVLREGEPGVYTGQYVVRREDRIDPAVPIRASLAVGPRTTIANYSFPPSFMALAGGDGPSPAPVARATAPLRIDRFAAAPVTRLQPGTELRFTLVGAPGHRASVDLPGLVTGVPLPEIRPGHYEGGYTLRPQDALNFGAPVATLRQGERWVRAQLAAPLVADTRAPAIANLVPRQGEVLPPSRGVTLLSGTFDDAAGSGVDPRSVRLTLGGVDMTPDVQVTPQQFSWRGVLESGRHTAEVSVRDMAGNVARQQWTFDVAPAASMGAAPATVLPLQVLSPVANATVSGSDVVVHGRTAPGASVRIKVDAVPPAAPGRVSVAQPVAEQTVLADAAGDFRFSLGPQRAPAGTRYEVRLNAVRGGVSAEQRLVLFQRPA